jgi:hypothetical protein
VLVKGENYLFFACSAVALAEMETVSVILREGVTGSWAWPLFCGSTEALISGRVSCARALAAVSEAIWLMALILSLCLHQPKSYRLFVDLP